MPFSSCIIEARSMEIWSENAIWSVAETCSTRGKLFQRYTDIPRNASARVCQSMRMRINR
jgi:hypothetical protein